MGGMAQTVANIAGRGELNTNGSAPLKIALASGTQTLLPNQNMVHCDASASFTVAMPSAGEAMPGVLYIVRLVDDATGTITVTFGGGTEDPGDWSLTALLDHGIAVSDGVYWHEVVTVET